MSTNDALYTREIAQYDRLLLLDDEDAKKFKFDHNVGRGAKSSSERQAAALACVRHVIQDFLGWTPREALARLTPSHLRMYRLDYLITKVGILPSYGFLNFDQTDNINIRYLLHLCYPDQISFSYAQAVLEYYRDSVKSKEIAQAGGSKRHINMPNMFMRGITNEDQNAVIRLFFQHFVSSVISPLIAPSNFGPAYDLYRFFAINRPLVAKLVKDNWLESIFKAQYSDYYDLLCEHILDVCSEDDEMARDMFAFVTISSVLPGASRERLTRQTAAPAFA